jgi:hypothetical protein
LNHYSSSFHTREIIFGINLPRLAEEILLERLATFDIDYRYAESDTERLRPLARELIALAPDVVFAGEPSAARAVKTLAPNVPIVCPVLGPVTRNPVTGIWAMINQAIDIAALVATELQDGGDPSASH